MTAAAIEAAARALHRFNAPRVANDVESWESVPPNTQVRWRKQAELALLAAEETVAAMSEEIRIGIMVGVRVRQIVREAEERADASEPGVYHCAEWVRKDRDGTPFGGFSSTLLEVAGGIDRLFSEWALRVVPVGKRER